MISDDDFSDDLLSSAVKLEYINKNNKIYTQYSNYI